MAGWIIHVRVTEGLGYIKDGNVVKTLIAEILDGPFKNHSFTVETSDESYKDWIKVGSIGGQ